MTAMTASWRCGPGVTMPWRLSLSSPKCYDGSVRGTLDRLKMCAAEECGGCSSIVRSRRRGDGACPRCAGTGPRPEPIASCNARPAKLRSPRLNTKFTSVNHWLKRSQEAATKTQPFWLACDNFNRSR